MPKDDDEHTETTSVSELTTSGEGDGWHRVHCRVCNILEINRYVPETQSLLQTSIVSYQIFFVHIDSFVLQCNNH